MREETEAAERGLPLDPGGNVVRQGQRLQGRAEDELPRVEDEPFRRVNLDKSRQLGLEKP